ncbi:MAG: adenosylhomocysteinase, partial [Nitrosotalea sp.]
DCHSKIHGNKKFASMKVLGGTEETTTGVIRLKALAKEKKLKYPVIAVNDAYTKHMFDNRYGTGQSTIDGYLRSMNLLFAGKRVVVAGYGWVGRGVASRCRGMGAKVCVTEVDPIRALEAHMDGFDVLPMADAAKIGEIFVTATGQTGIIRKEHILTMRNGAIMGNVGHFDVEVDAKFLLTESKSVREVRPHLDECVLKNGKHVYLIGKGRIANLVAAEGHPPEVMAQSFSNQLLSMMYIAKNHKKIGKNVITVPEEIDKQIAVDALKAMNVDMDKPTAAQIKYGQSWA